MDELLNLERRTGVRNDDIDDFIKKASAVEEAVRALREGTIAPEQIKIDGIDTEEEKAEKERKRQIRREELRIEEENLRLKRKQEEKERWWAGAEIHATRDLSENEEGELTPQQANSMDKYSANYSRWDQWTPQDPVTLQEEEIKRKEEEDRQNKLFEENNKEFCSQYIEDMETRKKQTEKKQQTATALKLKGNRFFKSKKYEEALSHYMDALKSSPYDGTAIVTNIAQAHIQLQNYDDALEFLNRALYLQPNCVKALSRKALILGERLNTIETNVSIRQKNLQEAIECLSKAYSIDSKNSEIAVQYQELKQVYQDLLNEQRVTEIQSNQSNQDLMASISNLTLSGEGLPVNQSADNDAAKKLLSSLASAEPSSLENMETVATFAVFDRFKKLLIEMNTSIEIDTLLIDTVLHALETDKSAQVYFRTNETLSNLLRIIDHHLTQIRESSQSLDTSNQSKLGSLIRILSVSLNEERSSKMLLIESYGSLLSSSIQLICQNDLSLDILEGLLSLLSVLTASSSQKSRLTVFRYKEFVLNISACVCRLISLLSEKNTIQQTERMIALCSSFLKDLVFSDDGKKCLLTQTGPGVIVPVLGSLLRQYQLQLDSKKKKKTISKELQQVTEVCVEILLGCSQSELLRSAFFDPVNGDGSDENQTNTLEQSINTVQLLLGLCQREEWAQANGLAILMNITIQEDPSSRQIVFECGALEVCLSVIKRNGDSIQGDYGRIRAIGLLSRLSVLSAVQDRLKQLEPYQLLVSMLISNSLIGSQTQEQEIEKWVIDERSQLVRTLASLTTLSSQCLSRASELGLVEGLLRCLPMPRMELNEVTPTSVILSPKESCQPLLVGNIARCLIPFADHPEHSRPLYSTVNYGVEKLICMMATCSDIRVRKNIAILLAKGCRNPETKKRVENLRGLQMIVELQHQLT